MKTKIVWSLTVLFVLSFALAGSSWAEKGYYIEEVLTSPPMFGQEAKEETVKTWILGTDMMRKDTKNGAESIIFRIDKGMLWIVSHAEKSYIEMTMEQFQSLASIGMAMFGKTSETGEFEVPEIIFKRTGRTKKIGKWDCYEVDVQGQGLMGAKSTQWIGTNTGFDTDIYVRIFKLTFGNNVPPEFHKLFEKMTTELDGYPVQTVTSINFGEQKYETTQTLIKLEKTAIESSRFDVPAGYTKRTPPPGVLPGMGDKKTGK